MMTDIQIRRIFLAKDASQIKKLQADAREFNLHYPKHHQWLDFAIKEVTQGRRYAFGVYRTSFSNSGIPSVDLVGSIILKREIYTNSFELKNLYVAPDYRNQGYGTALFEVVEQFCIKRGGIQIETEAPSVEVNTVKFLSKRSFFVQDHSESLFKPGDKIYRMVKKLPSKFTGDLFDLLSLSAWTFENIYRLQITFRGQNYFDFKIPIENGLNEIKELLMTGRCTVIDNASPLSEDEVKKYIQDSEKNITCITARNISQNAKLFLTKKKIFFLEFKTIKANFKNRFTNDFHDFERESIRGMIVPINYKYYSKIVDNTTSLTYFKGGPTGKFLKEDDYVLMCFEESPDYVNGGIKSYAKVEVCKVGSPDEIWITFQNDNPIFPEDEFMAWSVDKSEIVAFKIKDLKLIKTLNVRTVTGQRDITPFDNEKLGQFYLNEITVNKFLERKEDLDRTNIDDSGLPKVFLSSTIIDLSIERTEITELVRQDLSYNIFVSENAGSFSTPRETIINEIKTSDAYLCIVGERYGYEGIFDGRKISATHDEFLNAKKYNKPIRVYVKNVNKRDGKLDEFLQEIGDYLKGEKFQKFNSAKELRQFVRRDLAKLLKPS